MLHQAAKTDHDSETFERLGPIALKLIALAACVAVFAPLLAAFAVPFIG